MSTIKATTLSDLSNNTVPVDTVVKGTAKAWAKFNGVTATITRSWGFSSITKLGTGIYQVNFTTARPDADYIALANGNGNAATTTWNQTVQGPWEPTTTYFKVSFFRSAYEDSALTYVAVFDN